MSTRKHTTAELALGRILRLASRPARPGDTLEYERCRAVSAQAERQRCAGLDPIAIVSASAVAFLVELLRTSE